MKYKGNPLNIRYSVFNHWIGLSGEKNGFCEFESYEYGIRAGLVLLCRTYRHRGYITIEHIIKRFAPPSENNTRKYINFVVSKSGIADKLFLSSIKEYAYIISAMCYFESATIITVEEILRIAKEFDIHLKKRY